MKNMRKIKLFVILNFSILFILILVDSNVNVFSFVNNESEIENSKFIKGFSYYKMYSIV